MCKHVIFGVAAVLAGTCEAFVGPLSLSSGAVSARKASSALSVAMGAANRAPEETNLPLKATRRDLLFKGAVAVIGGSLATSVGARDLAESELADLSTEIDKWKGWEATRKFKRAGKEIEIQQNFAKTRQNGMAVYEGNEVMTEYLESLGKDYWQGKSVLELGCGTGFGSITAFLLGAKKVTASDRSDDVLALAKGNFDRNIKRTEMEGRSFETKRLVWGTYRCSAEEREGGRENLGFCYTDIVGKTDFAPSDAPENTFDVIIGSDLTYSEYVLPELIDTLSSFTHKKSTMILTWCEPKIFTWNTDVMEQLNLGLDTLDAYFDVEYIREGKEFQGHEKTFIIKMTPKPNGQMRV